jgi:hypothetical protein
MSADKPKPDQGLPKPGSGFNPPKPGGPKPDQGLPGRGPSQRPGAHPDHTLPGDTDGENGEGEEEGTAPKPDQTLPPGSGGGAQPKH